MAGCRDHGRGHRSADEIRDHESRRRRSQVDADHVRAVRHQVDDARATPAVLDDDLGAFDDQAVGDELVDDPGDGGGGDSRAPGHFFAAGGAAAQKLGEHGLPVQLPDILHHRRRLSLSVRTQNIASGRGSG